MIENLESFLSTALPIQIKVYTGLNSRPLSALVYSLTVISKCLSFVSNQLYFGIRLVNP